MKINTIHFSDLIQAFNWTLIHSLWQGLILAVLTGLVLWLTQKSRPALRYNLLVGLMLLFMVANVVTFCLAFQISAPKQSSATTLIFLNNVPQKAINESLMTVSQLNPLQIITRFCTENAAVIVLLWLVIFLTKAVQSISGLIYLNRLRYEKTHAIGDYWQARFEELVQKLNIKEKVSLIQSERVKVPIAIGVLKPLVLVPVGFLGSIPYDQVEAILLHELAHIRRRDFLVNLSQNFAESVFFFNPAVLWLSNLIREEREHCCDDLAIDAIQNKKTFVNALVVFQEYNLATEHQAVALTGKRNHLLLRIKRIVNNHNKQLDAMEKLFVTLSLVTVMGLVTAFTQNLPEPSQPPKPPKITAPVPPSPPASPSLVDTVMPLSKGTEFGNESQIHVTRNNKRYEITSNDDVIKSLKIDGVQIPKENIKDYLDEVEPIIEEIDGMKGEAEQAKEEAEQAKREVEMDRIDTERMRASAKILSEEAKILAREAEKMKIAVVKQLRDVDSQKETIEIQTKQIEKQAAQIEALAQGDIKKNAERMRIAAIEMRKEAEKLKAQAEIQKVAAEKIRAEYEEMHKNLMKDMRSEGLLKNGDNVSFKLSDSEFIVNSVKQSEEIHNKFKKKYLKDKKSSIVQNWNEGGDTISGSIIHQEGN